MDDNGSMKDSI